MPTVDTLVAQHLLKTVAAAQLMGADCIISGIRPQIAQTIVHLGIDLSAVATKASLAGCLRPGAEAPRPHGRARGGRRREAEPWTAYRSSSSGDFLLVTIQVDMHDQLALTLQDDLTQKIVATRARAVLIDISALEMVDSFMGRMLGNIAAMSRILDAQTVVVGMRPAVAITLVELGLSLPGIRTALNVDAGLALLREAVERPGRTRRWQVIPKRSRSAAAKT